MPCHNDDSLIPNRADPRLSQCILSSALLCLCVSGALGQVNGAQVVANRLDIANGKLKTCLQRHYEPGNDDMARYRLGDQLIAACRVEWETAEAACTEQPERTREYCDAQTNMMLLGFVPMH